MKKFVKWEENSVFGEGRVLPRWWFRSEFSVLPGLLPSANFIDSATYGICTFVVLCILGTHVPDISCSKLAITNNPQDFVHVQGYTVIEVHFCTVYVVWIVFSAMGLEKSNKTPPMM